MVGRCAAHYCSSTFVLAVIVYSTVAMPDLSAVCSFPYFYQDNILKTSDPQVMTATEVANWGLGLDDITDILNAHVGVEAEALHTDPNTVSLDQFRQSISDAMTDPDTYLIANFDRYEFMGEGGGHHSPLGAFCAESDAVLVLDVARYRSGLLADWPTVLSKLHHFCIKSCVTPTAVACTNAADVIDWWSRHL